MNHQTLTSQTKMQKIHLAKKIQQIVKIKNELLKLMQKSRQMELALLSHQIIKTWIRRVHQKISANQFSNNLILQRKMEKF